MTAFTVTGYPVADSRCPHCGHKKPTWTPPRIVEQLRVFHAEHGRAPFQREWLAATGTTPSATTVREAFGSWRAALEAAGVAPPMRTNTIRVWTRDGVIAAIFEWRFKTDRLPRSHEWSAQTEWHPSEKQVRRLFGTWNAALRAAGYEPTRKTYRTTTAGTGTTLDGASAGAREGGL